MIDFKPVYLDIKNKYRNLDVVAKGVVKGTKYFPVFLIDGEEYIFKPISKTKPYATTLFSYAEVYWSYVINKFFDSNTPVCKLAYCHGISDEQSKYYDKGILVKSTIKDKQKLINLLEYFELYPDKVDISNYINYCMEFYSYTDILNSDFIKSNPSLGEGLAWQILLSILRQDYNYHYENINFIMEDGKITGINPPIDFEFSCFFMFPDNKDLQKSYYDEYIWQLRLKNKAQIEMAKMFNSMEAIRSKNLENIAKIVEDYPHVVERFLDCLKEFGRNVDSINLSDENDFIELIDSNAWEIGYYTFKENNPEKLKKAYDKFNPKGIDKDMVFKRIKEQIKETVEEIGRLLNVMMYAKSKGAINLEKLTFEDLIELKAKDGDQKALEMKKVLEKRN